jgi:NAD(P)-dependent dehydrogenase (short-subunit alcohol dehydrogenase family)
MGILSGRVAILVGASSGVGYGCALDFAREGATVVAAARRLEKLEELAKDAAERGFEGKIHPVTCDAAKESDLDKIVKFTVDTFGRIEILACIAQGGLNHQTYLLEATEEEALDFYRTGPIYTMKLIQKCHPYMKAQKYGRVITCASGSAVSSTTGFDLYAMCKAAIMTLTRKAAQEFGRDGIVTNCIFPVIKNDIFGQDAQSADALEKIERGSPVGRLGDAFTDGAPMVSFLASEGARYINGQMIGICGGIQVLA